MIEISVGTCGFTLIFNQGKVTITGNPSLSAGFTGAGKSAYRVVGCGPASGDTDRNAALLIIGEYGGRVVAYVRPDHGNVTY